MKTISLSIHQEFAPVCSSKVVERAAQKRKRRSLCATSKKQRRDDLKKPSLVRLSL